MIRYEFGCFRFFVIVKLFSAGNVKKYVFIVFIVPIATIGGFICITVFAFPRSVFVVRTRIWVAGLVSLGGGRNKIIRVRLQTFRKFLFDRVWIWVFQFFVHCSGVLFSAAAGNVKKNGEYVFIDPINHNRRLRPQINHNKLSMIGYEYECFSFLSL